MAKKKMSLYKASEFHEKRSKRSRAIDESKTSKNTTKYPTSNWYKNPAGSDVLGIDTKKIKAKNVSEAISFLNATLKKNITGKDIEKRTSKKAIITHTFSARTLQKNLNVRFNNVKVYNRNKKGRPDDKWISILKK